MQRQHLDTFHRGSRFVGEPQEQVGAAHRLLRARDADPLDGIVRPLRQSGRIRQHPGDAVAHHRRLDSIPCGSGYRRDDRRFTIGERVEQRRLATVRRPSEHDPDPVAQTLYWRGREHLGQLYAQRLAPSADVLQRAEIIGNIVLIRMI